MNILELGCGVAGLNKSIKGQDIKRPLIETLAGIGRNGTAFWLPYTVSQPIDSIISGSSKHKYIGMDRGEQNTKGCPQMYDKVVGYRQHNAHVLQGDITSLPLHDNTIDMIILRGEDTSIDSAELYRVLRSHGTVYCMQDKTAELRHRFEGPNRIVTREKGCEDSMWYIYTTKKWSYNGFYNGNKPGVPKYCR